MPRRRLQARRSPCRSRRSRCLRQSSARNRRWRRRRTSDRGAGRLRNGENAIRQQRATRQARLRRADRARSVALAVRRRRTAVELGARQRVQAAQAYLLTAKHNTGQTAGAAAGCGSKRAALESAQANVKLLETQIAQTTLTRPTAASSRSACSIPARSRAPINRSCASRRSIPCTSTRTFPTTVCRYVRKGTQVTFTTPSIPGTHVRGSDLRRQRDADRRHAVVSCAHPRTESRRAPARRHARHAERAQGVP